MNAAKRSVGVVNVARSDYSILRPVMRAIEADPALELLVYVTGMHLAPEFGYTVKEIENDGFAIAERIEMKMVVDTPEAVSTSLGAGVAGFAGLFARKPPDIVMLMGDRFEFLAVAVAALPFRIPVAHLHGGERSEGAIDDSIRHGLTKFSHLHFVATPEYHDRVVQLGEEPWRVTVSGAPALDNFRGLPRLSRDELETRLGTKFGEAPLVVTFHPETHAPTETEANLRTVLDAVGETGRPAVVTYPNADAGGRGMIEIIEARRSKYANWVAIPNLGLENYYSLLQHAAAMVGNSSSGIIEAASFKLPVVNVGVRQRGRLSGANVIHAPAEQSALRAALGKALSADFRDSLRSLVNPYGDGQAAGRIVARLRDVALDDGLLVKRFHDLKANA